MTAIDYSVLGKAVLRLQEGLDALAREPQNTLYRDGVIQRFEFTYGLCATLLKRYLEQNLAVAPEAEAGFPSLIRSAGELGLLRSGWDVWAEFRRARNLTSHVYNEDVARQVVEQIPAFAKEAALLSAALQEGSCHGK